MSIDDTLHSFLTQSSLCQPHERSFEWLHCSSGGTAQSVFLEHCGLRSFRYIHQSFYLYTIPNEGSLQNLISNSEFSYAIFQFMYMYLFCSINYNSNFVSMIGDTVSWFEVVLDHAYESIVKKSICRACKL